MIDVVNEILGSGSGSEWVVGTSCILIVLITIYFLDMFKTFVRSFWH